MLGGRRVSGSLYKDININIYIYTHIYIRGFPKIRGTFLGVLTIRIIFFGGLHWGLLFWESTAYTYVYIYMYRNTCKHCKHF